MFFVEWRLSKYMKKQVRPVAMAFIKKLHENKHDQLFVKSMTDVAGGMGIKTVAEFVEIEETRRIITEFGVDYAQGYLIGKPGPVLYH